MIREAKKSLETKERKNVYSSHAPNFIQLEHVNVTTK